METLFERYRNLVVLLVMLLLQIVGLAVQVHRGDSGHMSLDPHDSKGVRLIRLWANAVVSPPERLFHSTGASTTWLWQNYFDLRHVRDENKDLQKNLDRLRLEQAALLGRRAPGTAPPGIAKFSRKIHLQDTGRANHRNQRQRPVAALLYR
jgi:rod shape-determining protein MreC